jgi:rhodanese-related sulfurtransferase
MMRQLWLAAAVCGTVAAGITTAQEVRLTVDQPGASFTFNGVPLSIIREQDPNAVLSGDFTRTSRACPPFCIQPVSVAPGVATLGELEVITFLETRVGAGTGLLIDARLPEWFVNGTIPGAVNVPFATLDATNPYRNDILLALGAVAVGDTLTFDAAFDLVLFCNGPWSDQSVRAVQNLLAAGYPPEKISYYRGGLQDWLILGLTTTTPEGAG